MKRIAAKIVGALCSLDDVCVGWFTAAGGISCVEDEKTAAAERPQHEKLLIRLRVLT